VDDDHSTTFEGQKRNYCRLFILLYDHAAAAANDYSFLFFALLFCTAGAAPYSVRSSVGVATHVPHYITAAADFSLLLWQYHLQKVHAYL